MYGVNAERGVINAREILAGSEDGVDVTEEIGAGEIALVVKREDYFSLASLCTSVVLVDCTSCWEESTYSHGRGASPFPPRTAVTTRQRLTIDVRGPERQAGDRMRSTVRSDHRE